MIYMETDIAGGSSVGVPSPGSQSDDGSAPSTPRCATPPTPDRCKDHMSIELDMS